MCLHLQGCSHGCPCCIVAAFIPEAACELAINRATKDAIICCLQVLVRKRRMCVVFRPPTLFRLREKSVQQARMGFSEIEKAHTRRFFSRMGFSHEPI